MIAGRRKFIKQLSRDTVGRLRPAYAGLEGRTSDTDTCPWADREDLVQFWRVVILTGAVLLTSGSVTSAAPDSGRQSESSLEPEFRQLRERLSSLPEFKGLDAVSKFRLAEELLHRGDVYGAIENYRAASELKPDWAEPYRGLGQVFLDHHDYVEAVQALQTSIRLGHGDHQAFYWLGRAFMGKGEFPASAVALERAVDLKPDDAEALADLGLVRMAQGDVIGAEQALTRSIQLKPDYAEAHQLRETLGKARHDSDAAAKAARTILQNLFARE